MLDGLIFLFHRAILFWGISLDAVRVSTCGMPCITGGARALTFSSPSRRMMVLQSTHLSGDMRFRAPEVLNALSLLAIDGVTEVEVDLSGQATFEAAMLCGYTLFRRFPIPGYPSAFTRAHLSANIVSYARDDVLCLDIVEHEALMHAGYPDGFVTLFKDALDPDPRARPQLPEFQERLITMLSISCSSSHVPSDSGDVSVSFQHEIEVWTIVLA